MSDPSKSVTRRCSGRTSSGNQCKKPPINGAEVCKMHGGGAPQVRKKAAVRAEVMAWGLTDQLVDPGETLLRLVAQSARRAARYADLLEQAYDAAQRIQDALSALPGVREQLTTEAKQDLDRVFLNGGVSALIGNSYSAAGKDGDIYASGEAIRGLVELESQERDRCARFCKLAIDAGIEAKKVELAQRQIDMLDTVMRAVLVRLGHRLDDPAIRTIVVEELDRLPALA